MVIVVGSGGRRKGNRANGNGGGSGGWVGGGSLPRVTMHGQAGHQVLAARPAAAFAVRSRVTGAAFLASTASCNQQQLGPRRHPDYSAS